MLPAASVLLVSIALGLASSEGSVALPPCDARLSALSRAAGGAWLGEAGAASGELRRAFGPGIALDTAGAGDRSQALRAFLEGIPGLLPPVELRPDRQASRSLLGGQLEVVVFSRVVDGVPVETGFVLAALRQGRLVYLHASGLGPIAARARPALDAEASRQVLGRPAALALARPALLFLSPAEGGRLVWRHRFSLPGGIETWVADVDAHSGELVSLRDDNRYACALDPAAAEGVVRGGIRPEHASDPEVLRNFPRALVHEGAARDETDACGHFAWDGMESTAKLDGRYFAVSCRNCTGQPLVSSFDGLLDFGTGGAQEVSNGRSTPADRSAFYSAMQGRELVRGWSGHAYLDGMPILATNLPNLCNAFWNGTQILFGRAFGGCENFAEVRDVVVHEWSHGLDAADGVAALDRALGEAYGDIVTFLVDRDSCVGEASFTAPPGGSYCESLPACPLELPCGNLRNMDEKRDPLGLSTFSNIATKCAPATGCAGPAGRECHCEASVMDQTFFHLAMDLFTGTSYHNGFPLPLGNPGHTRAETWFLLERLFLSANSLFVSYAPTRFQSLGVSAYDAFVVIDDDDADLANGTPHSAYINDAFRHHEIAELVPVPDAAACVPPAPPLPAAALDTDAVSGAALVRLSWADVDASLYRVTRSFGIDEGGWLVQDPLLDDNSPTYTLEDREVQAGTTLVYSVVAVSADGCPSAAEPPLTVTVALPELGARVASVDDAPPEGDGDGLAEPGERVKLRIDLRETAGLADFINARATLSTRDPLAAVTGPGPVDYGDVLRASTVPGPADFEVAISVSHACDSAVPLTLAVSGDNACALANLALDLPAGCTPFARGEVAPESIAVVSDTLGPCSDGDGLPDEGETVLVEVVARNVGTLGVASATVLLSSPNPHLGVVTANPAILGAIAPGASDIAQFEVEVSGAGCREPALLTATADSPENLLPRRASRAVTLEEDRPPVNLDLDFESGFGGWTAAGFSLTSFRAQGGSASAFAGPLPQPHACDSSTDGADACATLVSPPFLPAATSEFRLATWYALEPLAGGQYWDRANVHVVADGTHTLLTPISGRGYAGSSGHSTTLCHIDAEDAWAGNDPLAQAWATSVFSLAPWAGREIVLEIDYNTDALGICEGFYLDDLAITDARSRQCDATACFTGPPRVKGLRSARSGPDIVLAWDEEPLALGGYRVYRGEDDKRLVGRLRGSGVGPGVSLLGATAASSSATGMVDRGAAAGGPALLFYSVVGVAADGVTEGAN